MTKEEIAKEINESLKQFIDQVSNANTVSSIKSVLNSQIQELMNRKNLIRPAPIPSVEAKGTMVNVYFLHPGTGKMLTQQELDHWLNGGDL